MTAVRPRPFLKWVGGKRQLLATADGPGPLAKAIPTSFGDYHEAMLGGGALFWYLAAQGLLAGRRAHLSDTSERLVRTWRGVQRDVGGVLHALAQHAEMHEADPAVYFEAMRATPPDRGTDAEMAAWFIYINRAGFNGLYRVNQRGAVNVPCGERGPLAFDADNLCRCSDVLAFEDVVLRTESFTAARRAAPGDFVYFDPPYVPVSVTARFTSYTADGFGAAEHIRLRDTARTLARRGVHVVASNADVPWVRTAYAGFALEGVTARRAVNSDGEGRGPVGEVIIRGAPARTGARGRHVLLCDELGRTEAGGVR